MKTKELRTPFECKMKVQSIFSCVLLLVILNISGSDGDCTVPTIIRGTWFSFERGQSTTTDIDRSVMTRRGRCVGMREDRTDNVTLLFTDDTDDSCFHCVRFIVRTVNVLEKSESGCVTFPNQYVPSLEEACNKIESNQAMITMFNENFVPKNCRSALEGVWQFAYQNRFSFTGECDQPDQRLRSCQEPGNQFLIANQKFTINYTKCEGIKESLQGVSEFSCLGDWFVGKNHYFAAANTKESRKDEKFRCFIRNRDDDIYMGVSITPECSPLNTPENSPVRFRMTPVKSKPEEPGCLLPQNFTGYWINTAHTEADVQINETHITETAYPDEGRYRRTIYVCKEQRNNRYMMARLNIDGCQTDYVCFEFVPRHHNIIRFRKGLEMISSHYSTVCSYIQFESGRSWNYDLLLAKDPVAVKCPVAGKFNFTQKGEKDLLLQTRILGGVTRAPWDGIYCRENISDFSVCDKDQKEIWIDVNFCITVDAYGRQVDIYTDPDYKLKCIGYWKENLKSYLITYDELDSYSKYRCWVYQRADLHRVLMSQSVGPSCNLGQTVHADKTSLGAAVSLDMVVYEREHDRCPMNFDDGSNPYKEPGSDIHIFTFRGSGNPVGLSLCLLLACAIGPLLVLVVARH